jgi:dipeptidyl aminopeptidase/acylaminoacyl peptidase
MNLGDEALAHRGPLLASLLAALPALWLAPVSLAGDRSPVGLADYFAVRVASDPQISPDGKRVAYVLATPDLRSDRRSSSIRIVDTDGGADAPLDPGAQHDRHPRWSPQGDRLAFVRAHEGQFEIRVLRPPGQTQLVATLPSAPIGLAWSPTGDRLAYLASTSAPARAPVASLPPGGATWARPPIVVSDGGFQSPAAMLPAPVEFFAYVVDAREAATPRRLPSAALGGALPYFGTALTWSLDGRRLLTALARSPDHWKNVSESALYSIDAETGELSKVAAPTTTGARQPMLSGEGRMAFLATDAGRADHYFDRRLYLGPGEQGPFSWLHSDLDRPIVSAAWAPDGLRLYAVYLDEGVGRLAQLGLDGKRRVLATTGGGDASSYASGGSLSVARDGTVAFAFSDATTPSEIALVHPGRAPRVLTRNNAAYIESRVINPVESLRYRAADGREEIHAWLVKPASAIPGRKLPTLVLLHGGQSADYGPDFDLDVQTMAAHGYLVVLPNYRYSGSYGRRFGTRLNYPEGAEADVMGAVDALIERGIADPERLYIAGGSGGGAITAWTIGFTDRFRAAAVWNAPIEWSTYVFEAATGPSTMHGTFETPPWESPGDYFRRSPFARVGSVTTPTLVTIGTLDRVTPISQSILYFRALQYRGVPSELLVYPDEPHGIDAFPSHAMSHLAETLAWFARYGGPPLAPARF